MTTVAPEPRRVRRVAAAVASNPAVLWATFVATHLWLGYLNFYGPSFALNDVTVVYKRWMEQAVFADYWVGIDTVWVYPILALVPMLAAAVFGFSLYGTTWMSIVAVLNAVALAFLIGGDRRRRSLSLGWWWVWFLLLLGPIAIGRIDAMTIPPTLIGVIVLSRHPRIASILFTIGVWIKIWPVALLVAVVVATRDRWRALAAAFGTSAVIVALAVAFGGGLKLLSFITEQTGRGLQVEAPVTTFWMWQAWAGVPGATVYFDSEILTYQVTGVGVGTAASLMNAALLLAVATLCVFGLLALRRGVSGGALLPPLALALVVALIAFNKVGSPQYFSWLAVSVVLGLVAHSAGQGASFRVPAILVLVLAALTQAIYPTYYVDVIGLNPVMLVVLSARNLLVLVLFAWAVAAIVRLVPQSTSLQVPAPHATSPHSRE